MLGRMPSAEDVHRLTHTLKLDRPLTEQYVHFVKKTLALDLGESLVDRKPVGSTIMNYFPKTVILAVSAMVVSLLIAFPLALLAAFKKGYWHTLSMGFSALGLAMPGFLLGFLLINLFSVSLKLFPFREAAPEIPVLSM